VAKTGADILLDVLRNEGVDILFGYPGGSVIPIFDKFYDADIRVIQVRHEQAAAHAADGYARVTGRPGVCLATSGPGGTNLVTGIATAYFDSVPVVAITGQVKTPLIGNDAFQEADITGITRPITKHNYLVKDVNDLARVLREAFHIATTGRPGPVLVDLPVDVSLAEADEPIDDSIALPGYKPSVKGNARQIRLAAEAINAAERPVILSGGGVVISGATTELTRLARKASIPVSTTLLGLGTFPPDDELWLGMPGMHGTGYANLAIMQADLIVSVGARFDDRVTGKVETFAPHAKIVHVDIDPTSISKNVPVDVPVVGDAKHVLVELLKLVKETHRPEWRAAISELKKTRPLTYDRDSANIKPQYVIEQLYKATKGDAVIVTEVGQNQMWAAQWYRFKNPRCLCSSGGLGTMGYGFPAAIGAQFGRPDAVVIDIAGDGSIQMNIQELATVAQYELPVKVAILNNGYLGMVRQWQELFYDRRYAGTTLKGSPDFVKVAEAYGVMGLKIEEKDQVPDAIEQALATDGPVFMDFHIEPEENVFPMVPAGEAIDRMIGMA